MGLVAAAHRKSVLKVLQSQRFWLGLILVLTATLIAGFTYSLRSKPERTVRAVELPRPALPSLSVPNVGNQVAAEAIQQFAALQEKALRGAGMTPQESAAYQQATQNIAGCVGLQDDQPRLAECLGEKLRFLLDDVTPATP